MRIAVGRVGKYLLWAWVSYGGFGPIQWVLRFRFIRFFFQKKKKVEPLNFVDLILKIFISILTLIELFN